MTEQTWLVIREQGAIVEEAVDDAEDGDEPVDEKGIPKSFDEKVPLHAEGLAHDTTPRVVDIDIDYREPSAKEAASPHSSHSGIDVDVGT